MSNNVKFSSQQEAVPSKNHAQKKISLNSKNIPAGNSKAYKSFRGKITKVQVNKQPLEVINENDVNQGNVKQTNLKQKLTKMKSMDKVNNPNHSRHLSAFNMEGKSKNSKNAVKNKKLSSLNLQHY